MPYVTNADLPQSVRNSLPDHGQDIYRSAFNNALTEYGTEDIARKVAWNAVKKKYQKSKVGAWVAR